MTVVKTSELGLREALGTGGRISRGKGEGVAGWQAWRVWELWNMMVFQLPLLSFTLTHLSTDLSLTPATSSGRLGGF
jgi:hypothetical protein